MTPSRIITLADEIVGAIGLAPPGTFPGEGLSARRAIVPDSEIAGMDDLSVVVVPAGIEAETAVRTARGIRYTIHVGVRRRVADPEADTPGLIALCERLQTYLWQAYLPTGARPVSSSYAPIYDQTILREKRLFFGMLTLVYLEYAP